MSKVNNTLFFGLFTGTALIYILLFPYETAFYTKNAISICVSSVIPALFLFMVFTKILAKLCAAGFMSGKISEFFSNSLGLPVCLVPICLAGLICGAPSGAVSICNLYSDGYCSKEDAERACILTGNCSGAFIMGIVSATLGCKFASVYILISNLASTLTVYMLLYRGSSKQTKMKQKNSSFNFYDALSDSIVSSASSVIKLSSYVVFFYTIGAILSTKAAGVLQSAGISSDYVSTAKSFICSLFEICLGLNSLRLISGTKAIIIASVAVSFTGVSIIFQVTGIMKRNGLPIRDYIFSKVLCALLCPVYVTVILLISPYPVSVFSHSAKSQSKGFAAGDAAVLLFVTVVVFAAARFLSYLDKKYKK